MMSVIFVIRVWNDNSALRKVRVCWNCWSMGDGLASTQVLSWLLLACLKKSTEHLPRQGREEVYF